MRRFRISARLYALVAFALLAMAAALTFGLVQAQDKLVAERKAMLSAMNENAVAVFEAYHKQEQAGTLSREEAQKRALEAIKAMRYQDSGYFWVNDMQPAMVMHPIKPELDGKDLSQNKDPNGNSCSSNSSRPCRLRAGASSTITGRSRAPRNRC